MPFSIIREDITRVAADAIVNTANPWPIYGGGTDYAIYKAAGADLLLAERRKIGMIEPGQAASTKACNLRARYIIHTVGPVWQDGRHGEYDTLRSCYDRSLHLAADLGCESIAFPLISTGTYGFPKDRALDIAIDAISSFLNKEEEDMDVILVVFDKKAYNLSAAYVDDVRQYINDHYVEKREKKRFRNGGRMSVPHHLPMNFDAMEEAEYSMPAPSMSSLGAPDLAGGKKKRKLSDLVKNVGETFQERLFRLIDEKGMTDAQVYKRANVDRKQFSKIRCNPDYKPGKRTVVALAIALELNLDETIDLLSRLGYAFSPASKADLIVEYCIDNGIYDIFEINSLLFEYDQLLLGSIPQDHAG